MQPNELKALLTKTNEVAIYPAHVEVQVENQRFQGRRGRSGPLYCPSGLVKATVIEDAYPWVERRPIAACGDQEYEIKRKNGVLVEIDPTDLPKTGQPDHLRTGERVKLDAKRDVVLTNGRVYPHCWVETRDGKNYIRLVTSRKAIFSSWGEYTLEIARREKESEETSAKYKRLYTVQAALMGVDSHVELNTDARKAETGYLSAAWDTNSYDAKGNYIEDKNKRKEVGHITITVEQAEKIWNMLTPKQRKALRA